MGHAHSLIAIALTLDSVARNLVAELGLLADHFETEMAPKKDEKKAAGPAKIPRTDTRSAAYHKYGGRKAQDGALVVEIEKAQDSNIGLRVAGYEAQQELKPVSVQHETLLEMTTIENQCRVIEPS